MRTFAQKLMSDCEKGATAIEYGLIAALISVAAIAAMTTLGKSLSTMFTAVSTELLDAVSSI
ncbi:MAG: Flp family type IVb pilin [Proteobacteria bacterium]|nr:Flp family type IVb pilin [Pseudomonadota bacterium]